MPALDGCGIAVLAARTAPARLGRKRQERHFALTFVAATAALDEYGGGTPGHVAKRTLRSGIHSKPQASDLYGPGSSARSSGAPWRPAVDQGRCRNPRSAFLAFFAARFSSGVLAAFFFWFFFWSMPLLMTRLLSEEPRD